MALRSNLWSCSTILAGMDAANMTAEHPQEEDGPVQRADDRNAIDNINLQILVSLRFLGFVGAIF